jgi:hypothetical protein
MLKWTLIALVGILLFFVLSATLDHITNVIGWDLWPKIIRSRRAIRRLLRTSYPDVRVWSLGASRIDPKHFCICIDVKTDVERDNLMKDKEMEQRMRRLILQNGYPPDVVPILSFSIESKQTIDRNFGGSSWHARK